MIDIQIDPTAMRAHLQRILNGIQNLPKKKASRIQSIIKGGIRHNFNALSNGKSVIAAGSNFRFALMWPQVRHVRTWKIRRSKGLGGIFPILHLTGFLEEGLFSGSFSSGPGSMSYKPRSDAMALISTHQNGGPVLPSRKTGKVPRAFRGVNVPPRPMVFWSQRMAEGVIEAGADLAREVARR